MTPAARTLDKRIFASLFGALIMLFAAPATLEAQAADSPYLGEIMLVSFDFAPKGWAECNGQILSISQNQALFALLGTTYGGDGKTTFALPDLRGRVPVHAGSLITLGEKGGEETHAITFAEMPQHSHTFRASSEPGDTTAPAGMILAKEPGGSLIYGTPDGTSTLSPVSVEPVGGAQPHENRMPYTALRYIIALTGIFPTRN
jgi:microcystin-dependent protein